MARLRIVASFSLGAAVASCLWPVICWQTSGPAAWLSLVPILILGLSFLLLQAGLWRSRGNLWAFLRGQVPPRTPSLQRDIIISTGQGIPFEVSAEIALDRPRATVSSRHLSFAIGTSQLVGGTWWDPKGERVEWSSGTVPSPQFSYPFVVFPSATGGGE